jgi:hypothetical protein
MITAQKTTRGMVVTILNYDKYQDPKNYESHKESHSDDHKKATDYRHDRQEYKELKNEKKKIKTFSSDSDEIRLSKLLLSFILKRDPKYKKPDIQKWANTVNKMIRLDERNPAEIEAVIQWCQADDFWQNNILSIGKLREQYSQLKLKMEQRPKGGDVDWTRTSLSPG